MQKFKIVRWCKWHENNPTRILLGRKRLICQLLPRLLCYSWQVNSNIPSYISQPKYSQATAMLRWFVFDWCNWKWFWWPGSCDKYQLVTSCFLENVQIKCRTIESHYRFQMFQFNIDKSKVHRLRSGSVSCSEIGTKAAKTGYAGEMKQTIEPLCSFRDT